MFARAQLAFSRVPALTNAATSTCQIASLWGACVPLCGSSSSPESESQSRAIRSLAATSTFTRGHAGAPSRRSSATARNRRAFARYFPAVRRASSSHTIRCYYARIGSKLASRSPAAEIVDLPSVPSRSTVPLRQLVSVRP